MKNKKKFYFWLILSSIVLLSFVISLFSYFFINSKNNNKNTTLILPNNNYLNNNFDLSKSIEQTNLIKEIIDIKNISGYYTNFFSIDLFKKNIFNIINESLKKFQKQNKIVNFFNFEFKDYNKKLEYEFLNNEKTINMKLFLINNINKNIYYQSWIQFLIV